MLLPSADSGLLCACLAAVRRDVAMGVVGAGESGPEARGAPTGPSVEPVPFAGPALERSAARRTVAGPDRPGADVTLEDGGELTGELDAVVAEAPRCGSGGDDGPCVTGGTGGTPVGGGTGVGMGAGTGVVSAPVPGGEIVTGGVVAVTGGVVTEPTVVLGTDTVTDGSSSPDASASPATPRAMASAAAISPARARRPMLTTPFLPRTYAHLRTSPDASSERLRGFACSYTDRLSP
jgi:hypothetical protein